MKARGAPVLDLKDWVKWWDGAYELIHDCPDVPKALELFRESQHPDAQWAASLFPEGAEVTQESMHGVMAEQGEDPRALFLLWTCREEDNDDMGALTRAAQMGYAAAQGWLCQRLRDVDESFAWAQKACESGDRNGIAHLADAYHSGKGCVQDEARAIELYRQAAELEDVCSQHTYGQLAFGELDWRRYHWWAKAFHRDHSADFSKDIWKLLPHFEKRELGRILYIVAPLLSEEGLDDWTEYQTTSVDTQKMRWVQDLHRAMIGRAERDAVGRGVAVGRAGTRPAAQESPSGATRVKLLYSLD
jgi:hypothetical protein